MQIFVDADACPVVDYKLIHVLSSDYSEVIVVGAGQILLS